MLGGHLFRVFGLPPRRRHCAFSPSGVLRERATRGGGFDWTLHRWSVDFRAVSVRNYQCECCTNGSKRVVSTMGGAKATTPRSDELDFAAGLVRRVERVSFPK